MEWPPQYPSARPSALCGAPLLWVVGEIFSKKIPFKPLWTQCRLGVPKVWRKQKGWILPSWGPQRRRGAGALEVATKPLLLIRIGYIYITSAVLGTQRWETSKCHPIQQLVTTNIIERTGDL